MSTPDNRVNRAAADGYQEGFQLIGSVCRAKAMELQDVAAIKGHLYLFLLAAAGTIVCPPPRGSTVRALCRRLCLRPGCGPLCCAVRKGLPLAGWRYLTQVLLPLPCRYTKKAKIRIFPGYYILDGRSSPRFLIFSTPQSFTEECLLKGPGLHLSPNRLQHHSHLGIREFCRLHSPHSVLQQLF